MFSVLSVLQGCILFCLFIIQPWFYPGVKYFNAICFMCFIFVNSVIVSSIITCNDLYQNFIIMYVWYFVSRNSISVLGAIWPSLSPCTVINPILLTYSYPKFNRNEMEAVATCMTWFSTSYTPLLLHYSGVIMSAIVSQITSVSIVYLKVYSGADQTKHQSSASLVPVEEIQMWSGIFPAHRASNTESVPIW